ncbi:hypothetical protein BJ165DRAFT_1429351 [Panaeolus papilionaceus]|nr:hypothetical protein BJ165DRAFT_1429351 [Panaeolus papilionaceus]
MQSGGLRTSQGGLGLTMQEVMQLLNATEIEELEEEEPEEEEDDEDEDEDEDYTSRRYHSEPDWYPTATKEPKAEGLELLKGGDFGRTGVKLQARSKRYNSVQSVLARSSTPVPLFHKEDIHATLVPNTNGTAVAKYDANMYTAQFSDGGCYCQPMSPFADKVKTPRFFFLLHMCSG